ncbi:retinoschisin-like [Branchiostoma floridae x Branchiostoma japonicum]
MRELFEVKNVIGIITKGRNFNADDWPYPGSHNQYVTSYVISYGVQNGDERFYTGADNQITVFRGNSDRDTPVRHNFRDCSGPAMITARFIKIHPKTWHEWIAMRAKILIQY